MAWGEARSTSVSLLSPRSPPNKLDSFSALDYDVAVDRPREVTCRRAAGYGNIQADITLIH